MRNVDFDVAIIGAGAAGLAAGRRLAGTGLAVIILEARDRTGGRAHTVAGPGGAALDMGCGWLHSADRNPWVGIAEQLGLTVDRADPPWNKPAANRDFPPTDQRAYRDASESFYARLEAAAAEPDRAAAELLAPGSRWNPMLEATSTYYNGAELERVSVLDFHRYEDSGVNWRVVEGYGRAVRDFGQGLQVKLNCAVSRIDHRGKVVQLETTQGMIRAGSVIVTISTHLLATEAIRFDPPLPDKVEAAHVLPLGVADKLFLTLDRPDILPPETRLHGSLTTSRTASFHWRPFGRPLTEVYFGGALAIELELDDAFVAFAVDQLVAQLGSDIRSSVHPVARSAWHLDPWAGGSYSHALPGHSGAREILAAPVDGRLFFAGEACSIHSFSTTHGAYETGIAAAEAVLRAP